MAIEVATAEDLYNVRNNLAGDYVQVADIDLSVYPNWLPIGNSTTPFTGNYNGNNYKISNLTITSMDDTSNYYAGLFSYAVSDGTGKFENIIIENFNSAISKETGCIAGHTVDYNILNCRVNGATIDAVGYRDIGGLVAEYYNEISGIEITIADCEVKGLTASNGDDTGGLIGEIQTRSAIGETILGNIEIRDCVVRDFTLNTGYGEDTGGFIGRIYTSKVSEFYIHGCRVIDTEILNANTRVGGFAGRLYVSKGRLRIEDCSAENISLSIKDSARGSSVGGFAGYISVGTSFESYIEKSFATGSILEKGKETTDIGGFCGVGYIPEIRNCYTRFGIEGYDDIGGFVGYPYNTVFLNCYSANKIRLNGSYIGHGGFAGRSSSEYYNCYYDSELSGLNDDDGRGIPRATDEMTIPYASNTYLNWDFNNVWHGYIELNDGYPQFEVYVIPDERIFFLESPEVREEIPKVNQLTVRSPEAEYLKTFENVSRDKYIERIVELDQGDFNVCKTVAERLADVWGRKRTSIIGEIFLRQDLSFKNVVRIKIPEIGLNGPMKVQRVAHDVINQRTKVTCGDLILSDNELLSRILAEI